jgi:alkylhydroperoxidase family enzyme
MSRLSILPDDKLTDEMRRQAQAADRSGAGSTVLRVLGHRPDMIESYFKFYYPLHNGGIVDPALKEMVRLRIASLNQCLT